MAEAVAGAGEMHLPPFVAGPGGEDFLFNVVIVMVLAAILLIGVLYFRLHALPERMAHRTSNTQLQLVGILCLLALFTHNNIFWVAALLLAAIQMPDLTSPLRSIAVSLERLAKRDDRDA